MENDAQTKYNYYFLSGGKSAGVLGLRHCQEPHICKTASHSGSCVFVFHDRILYKGETSVGRKIRIQQKRKETGFLASEARM